MTRLQTIELYQFDELSDAAKEKARDWWRAGGLDYDWWDCTYDDAKTCAALIGIEIENIWFSGFWSQGDGACFEGRYHYAKGGVAAIKQHAPQDEKLHRIASDLQELQRWHFYQLSASVKQIGRYSHEYSTAIDVYKDGYYADAETADGVAEALRDFMRWIYRQLEAEHDYLNSDESVDETIRCNEYEFHEDGSRA